MAFPLLQPFIAELPACLSMLQHGRFSALRNTIRRGCLCRFSQVSRIVVIAIAPPEKSMSYELTAEDMLYRARGDNGGCHVLFTNARFAWQGCVQRDHDDHKVRQALQRHVLSDLIPVFFSLAHTVIGSDLPP
jgi:hypothetical protein